MNPFKKYDTLHFDQYSPLAIRLTIFQFSPFRPIIRKWIWNLNKMSTIEGTMMQPRDVVLKNEGSNFNSMVQTCQNINVASS